MESKFKIRLNAIVEKTFRRTLTCVFSVREKRITRQENAVCFHWACISDHSLPGQGMILSMRHIHILKENFSGYKTR